MASNLRSIYKSTIKEKTTISTRRKSRNLERKQNRDDEVSKRRLLSDDMSPVVEDISFEDKEDKPSTLVHKKAPSRLERLKQWREERKRKTKTEKKQIFRVSSVTYTESALYKRTESNEIEPAKKDFPSIQAKLAAAIIDKKSASSSIKAITAPSQVDAPRPSGVASKTRQNKITKSAKPQSTEEPSRRSTRQTVASKSSVMTNPSVVQVPVPQRGKTDLFSKMTASAAAKAKTNLDKPKEFLRAKSKVQLGTVQNTKGGAVKDTKRGTVQDTKRGTVQDTKRGTVQDTQPGTVQDTQCGIGQDTQCGYSKQQNIVEQEKRGKKKSISVSPVENNNLDVAAIESSPDSKELLLTNSAVTSPRHSTPAPRGGARANRRSGREKQMDTKDLIMRLSKNIDMRVSTPFSSRRNLPVNTSDEGSEQEKDNSITLSSQEKVIACSLFVESAEIEEIQCTQENEDHADYNSTISSAEKSPKPNIAVDRKLQSSRKKNHPTKMKPEEEVVNDLEMSDKENIVHENIKIKEEILRKSASRWNLNVSDGAQTKRKSQRLSTVNKESSRVAVYLHTPSAEKSSDASQSRTRKQRLISSNNDEAGTLMGASATTSTAKRPRRVVTVSSSLDTELRHTLEPADTIDTLMGASATTSTAKRPRRVVTVSSSLDTELRHTLEPADTDDTQMPVIEYAKPSLQEVKIGSAVASRRSVRIAGFVSSSTSDSNSENEVTEKATYPKTPRFRRRQSTRTSLTNNDSHRSTFVSVSDEGTSDVIGESVVDKMTPHKQHTQHLPVSGKSTSHRRSIIKSEIIDVSDEGTALSNDLDSGTVYQVGKSSKSSSRALQELAVQKFDGEVSFIEVPVDESADGNFMAENMSPSKPMTVSAGDDEVMAEENNSSTTEDYSPCTQLFTPRGSSEMSKMTLSSTENFGTPLAQSATSNTPRSSRNRGLSISGFSFKTPGEPASAILAKSQRKRRRTQTTPIKSPEEMIEILKKSPMVEMTRRRSRHVSTPDIMDPRYLDALLTASPRLETTNAEDVSCKTAGLSQPDTIEQVQENGGVRYFRELLVSETNRLNQLGDQWNEISRINSDLSEDALGQIRLAVGKAQLLMDQRFKQFSGLVDDCEFSHGEKETTLTDLQGFWEMIYIQVEDVIQLFARLTELQQKNWVVNQPPPTKDLPKRKAIKTNKPKIRSNFAGFREEMLKRKVQAAQVTSSSASIDSEASGTTKTFDAGYFQVKSPIQSPSERKSLHDSPLKPVVSDAGEATNSTQVNFTQVVEKPAQGSDDQQLGTPVSQGNKENNVANPVRRFSSASAKRLSYLPVVPSPLLNDITGLRPKK